MPVFGSTMPGTPTATASRRSRARSASRLSVTDLVGHGSQQRLRVRVPRGWDDAACEQLAAEIGETEPRACRTDVDAGDERVARVELHAAGPASPAGRTGAEIVQDAETNQGRGKAAHGRRGKSRGLDELGAGELTLVRDGRRKHALQIETPDVCRVSSGFDVGSSVFEQAHRRIPSRHESTSVARRI